MEAELEWKKHSATTPAAENFAPNLTGYIK